MILHTYAVLPLLNEALRNHGLEPFYEHHVINFALIFCLGIALHFIKLRVL